MNYAGFGFVALMAVLLVVGAALDAHYGPR